MLQCYKLVWCYMHTALKKIKMCEAWAPRPFRLKLKVAEISKQSRGSRDFAVMALSHQPEKPGGSRDLVKAHAIDF